MLDRVPTHDTSSLSGPRELRLLYARMHCLQGFQESHKWRRQFLERRDLGREQGVSAGRWLRQEEESRDAWRLQLVADVRVPESCGDAVAAFEIESGVGIAVDEMKLRIILWVTGGRMDVQAAEMPSPF